MVATDRRRIGDVADRGRVHVDDDRGRRRGAACHVAKIQGHHAAGGAGRTLRCRRGSIRDTCLLYSTVNSLPSRKTTNPFIQKVRYQSLAHAYALNRPYAEILAYQPWKGIIIDTLFRPLTDHVYAVYPMFSFQNDFSSDNDKKYKGLERFRRLLGGLERIQKANEFYQRHKFSVIAIHGVIILSILIFLLAR